MFVLLFVKELRRALLPTALILLAVFGALTAIERLYPLLRGFFQFEPRPPLNLGDYFPLLLVFCAFGCGIGAFPRKLKETHYVFLQSLPLGRRWLWLAIVLGHLLALLACVPIVPALAPQLLAFPFDSIFFEVCFAIIAFAAGCCFALMVRRTVLAYGAGTLICMLLFVQLTLTMLPYVPAPPRTDPEISIGGVLPFLSFLALVFFSLSCRFFVSGDFPHRRQRLKNWAVFILVFTAFFSLSRAHTTAWLIAGGRWEQLFVEVSGNGKRLCLVEALAGLPRFCRVQVLDCDTGETLNERSLTMVSLATWSTAGDVVTLFSVERPWLGISRLRPGQPLFEFVLSSLGPGSGLQSQRAFADEVLLEVVPAGRGRFLSAVTALDRSFVVRLVDAGTLAETELLHAPEQHGEAYLWPVGDQIFVDLPNSRYTDPSTRPRAWLVDTTARELRSLAVPTPQAGDSGSYRAFLVHDTVYRSRQEAADALLKLSPPPPGSGPIQPVLAGDISSEMGASAEATAVFGLAEGGLMAYRKSDRTWSRLADLVPLTGAPQPVAAGQDPLWIEGREHLRDRFHADVLPDYGLAVYLVEEGSEVRARLHDAHAEASLEFGAVGAVPLQRSAIGIRKVTGLEGFLVDLSPVDGKGPAALFQYVPGSSRLESLPESPAAPEDIRFLVPGGRQIYEDRGMGGIFVLDPGQTPRRIGP